MDNLITQYRTITAGAGWIEKSSRSRLRFSGRDAVSFLQALLSNDIAAISPGQGTYATYLTPQGRMIADMVVYRFDDHVMLDVNREGAADLLAKFDLLLFAEDVRMEDVTPELAQLAVLGAESARVVAAALGVDASAVAQLGIRGHMTHGGVTIARTDDAQVGAIDVFVPAARRDSAIQHIADAGAIALGPALIDTLRIEAGRPLFGVDMGGDTIPLEAGLLDRAISTRKGCYVGQEIIVRVLHRGGGRVAKRLVQLLTDEHSGASLLPAGATIEREGADVGRVTSSASSTRPGRTVALGYVKREHAEVGSRLTVDGHEVEVIGLAG